MWMLDNRTPYAAGGNWTRDKAGVHHWLVAVKATFDVATGGKLTLADEQPPPVLAPEYRGDPANTSLLLDSDLLAPKPGTDILLDACAHAPKGRPAAKVPVSLRVGSLEKTLLVYGTRVYYQGVVGLAMSAARPFTVHPIHYEWAFGGTDVRDANPRKHRIDPRNPVGKGFATNPAHLENQVAHAIEYPNGNAAKAGPAGFGPLAAFWLPRLSHAGTYDERWEKSKKPLLPDDYDDRFALAAPDDQRPSSPLRGGETITLLNMTPEGALRFDLPRIQLAFSSRILRRIEDHQATLTTVFVAPEQRKLSLVWQSALRVPKRRELEYLDWTFVKEGPFV
jgi:hypothetical protein